MNFEKALDLILGKSRNYISILPMSAPQLLGEEIWQDLDEMAQQMLVDHMRCTDPIPFQLAEYCEVHPERCTFHVNRHLLPWISEVEPDEDEAEEPAPKATGKKRSPPS